MTSWVSGAQGQGLVLFFSRSSVFSNHYPAQFTANDGTRYSSTEQYYMRHKCLEFDDDERAHMVMCMDDPGQQKILCKGIPGFDQARWNRTSRGVMRTCLVYKFTQNKGLKEELLRTGERTLVECSPYDRRWGVGLHIKDPRALDPSKWRGENWLGTLLMEVREEIKQISSPPPTPLPPPVTSNDEEWPHLVFSSLSSHSPATGSIKVSPVPRPVMSPQPPSKERQSENSSSRSSFPPPSSTIQRLATNKTLTSKISTGPPPEMYPPPKMKKECSSESISSSTSHSSRSPLKRVGGSPPPRSANLWPSSNPPSQMRKGEEILKPPLTRTPKKRKKKAPAPHRIYLLPIQPTLTPSESQSESNPSDNEEAHLQPPQLIPPPLPPQQLIRQKLSERCSKAQRSARLATYKSMTKGWLLHLASLAQPNKIKLHELLSKEVEGPVDRRKVSNFLKVVKDEEAAVASNHGDYVQLYETIFPLSKICTLEVPQNASSRSINVTPRCSSLPPSFSRCLSPSKCVSVSTHHSPNSPIHSIPTSSSSAHSPSPTSIPPDSPILHHSPPSTSPPPSVLSNGSTSTPQSSLPLTSPITHPSPHSSPCAQPTVASTPLIARTPSRARSIRVNPLSIPLTRSQSQSVSRLNQNIKRLRESRESYKSRAELFKEKNKVLAKAVGTLSSKCTSQERELQKMKTELSSVKGQMRAHRKAAREASKRTRMRDEEVAMTEAPESSGKVITKVGREYTPACKKALLEAKSCGVSDANAGKLLYKAVKSLTGRSLSHTPTASTTARTVYGGLALTQKQSHHVLSGQIARQKKEQPIGMSLLSDETTKRTHKLQAYSLTVLSESGERVNHVIGVKEVSSKDADLSLRMVIRILDEIDRAGTASPVHAQIASSFRDLVLSYINSAMGDRASTQAKFARLLQEYRKNILPFVREGWDSMTPREQYLHGLFMNVPCMVHIVASITEPVIAALAQQQIDLTGAKDLPLDNPSVLVLLREMTKHFGPRSSAKYATYKKYLAWCKETNHIPIRLPSLKGNRFNVVMKAAANVYAYHDNFVTFMNACRSEDLQAMRNGLHDELMAAHLHVLALVNTFVTEPLWRIANGNMSILETPKMISELLKWVDARAANPSLLFSGKAPKLIVPSQMSSAFRLDSKLVKFLISTKPERFALQAAKRSMVAISEFLRRVFRPFLPGGEYHSLCTATGPTAIKARTALAATPANNVPSESIFGLVDWLMDQAPTKRVSRVSAETMLRKNHTLEWIDGFPQMEQEQILRECFKLGPILEREGKGESEQVTKDVFKRMNDEAAHAQAVSARVEQKVIEMTYGLIDYGYFHDQASLDNFLSRRLATQTVYQVMCSQLKYRKKVLSQGTFSQGCFTVKPRSSNFTLEGLIEKVRKAITHDKNITVRTFCGKDTILTTARRYEYVSDETTGVSFPSQAVACRKVSKNGPSYVLMKFLCGREKCIAVREDVFLYYLQRGIFRESNARARVGDGAAEGTVSGARERSEGESAMRAYNHDHDGYCKKW